MTFVNEYVSEDDVKKYQLDELWFKYNPGKKEVPSYFQHHWTVDKENNVYFVLVDIGREEHSNRLKFILYINGDLFEVVVEKAKGGSLKYNEQPYKIVWELIAITPTILLDKHKNIISILQNALSTYGVRGILKQVPNTIAEFKNFD